MQRYKTAEKPQAHPHKQAPTLSETALRLLAAHDREVARHALPGPDERATVA